MAKVSPDLDSLQPLHRTEDPDIAAITRAYANHIGARGPLPIVMGRYEPTGLYGGEDPGRQMPIPVISSDLSSAVIVAGKGRRR